MLPHLILYCYLNAKCYHTQFWIEISMQNATIPNFALFYQYKMILHLILYCNLYRNSNTLDLSWVHFMVLYNNYYICALRSQQRCQKWWFSGVRTSSTVFLGGFSCIFIIQSHWQRFQHISSKRSAAYTQICEDISDICPRHGPV